MYDFLNNSLSEENEVDNICVCNFIMHYSLLKSYYKANSAVQIMLDFDHVVIRVSHLHNFFHAGAKKKI